MKIIDWIKNIFTKNKYMLNEASEEIEITKSNTDFIEKVDVSKIEYEPNREEILKSLTKDIIVEDLSEEYNYTKFSDKNIQKKYDNKHILSKEDLTAISCLYGAIKQGNMHERDMSNNTINKFLKASPDNIVTMINLMIKDAEIFRESIKNEYKNISVQALIPGSYEDVSEVIDKYINENEQELEGNR